MALKATARTYGAIHYDGAKRRWTITSVEPHVAIRLKALFKSVGTLFSAPYHFSDKPDVCMDLEWFMERYPLEISAKDKARLQKRRREQERLVADLEACLSPAFEPRPLSFVTGELRHYQAQAVEILLRNGALLCGDVVGLGKTFVCSGALTQADARPGLVVVETHLTEQWRLHLEYFLGAKVHVIRGTKPYKLPEADVYIIKYSCLAGWAATLSSGRLGLFAFDEVQALRRHDSNRYRAAKAIASAAKYVLGLSATPIYNWADDIFNIIEVLKPGALGTRDEFEREWSMQTGAIRKIRDPQALGTYLRECYLFLRRTREEVGRELPPVNTIVHTVDHDEREVKKHEDLARQLAMKVVHGSFVEQGQAGRELDILMRQATGIAKARHVAAYVRMLVEAGEKVVLAGWHREVYSIWLEELKDLSPVMYTGSETAKQKRAAEQAFIKGDARIFILSLRSGTGLDGLQFASSIAVFGELDWSPMIHEQLIGRLRRDGQDEDQQVTALYLVSDSGSDPAVIERLGLKRSEAQGVIDPMSPLQVAASDESRIKDLALRILAQTHDVDEQDDVEPAA